MKSWWKRLFPCGIILMVPSDFAFVDIVGSLHHIVAIKRSSRTVLLNRMGMVDGKSI